MIIDTVQEAGHQALDLGAFDTVSSDYPDFALKIGRAILDHQAERGVLICGSGVGACVAANKIQGIYAGMCHDTYSAHQGVEHDDMNVLCLGARIIGPALAARAGAGLSKGAVFWGGTSPPQGGQGSPDRKKGTVNQ